VHRSSLFHNLIRLDLQALFSEPTRAKRAAEIALRNDVFSKMSTRL